MERRLLLVGPSFFGYRSDIAKSLSARGWDVEERSDRPSESVRYKSLYKLGAKFVESEIEGYAKVLASAIENGGYQAVLFVGGMSFPFSSVQFDRMRVSARETRFVAYLWDSIANCQRMGSVLERFDAVFSFEPVEMHDVIHLPLFFTEEYEAAARVPLADAQYDACFVGSVHQVAKLKAVLQTVDALKGAGLAVKTHFYMPSRSSLMLRRLQDQVYRRRDIEFTHRSLSRMEIADLYSRCACVIDSPQSGQTGLTMRTIEALGAGRKVITSNKSVTSYDFYNYGDVFVPNGDKDALVSFAMGRSRRTPDSSRRGYSLESWTDTVSASLED